MNKKQLIAVLKHEIQRSTGCTDPGSVCLAVSRATRELGKLPDQIKVIVSPNIFKNGVSVGIPGTDKNGLHLAAALGALIDKSEEGLGLLSHVTPKTICSAENIVQKGIVNVKYKDFLNPLYVKAIVANDQDQASAIIEGDYANITQVTKNSKVVYSSDQAGAKPESYILVNHSVHELYKLITSIDYQDISFLIDHANVNQEAVIEDLGNPNMQLGKLIDRNGDHLGGANFVVNRTQMYTAAAGEARMRGLNVPIMAVSGSGNHGITNFLGILAVANTLNSSREELAKALAISTMITVYIKGYIQRMTAFCGCAVAAATGVAAGTVYLLGGNYQQGVNAMQSVVGTLSGMFCDGAKESCAYKLSTAASMAVQFAYLSMKDCFIPPSIGIVGPTIEKTFANLGRLNNPGMVETDKVLVAIIEDNLSRN